MIKKILCIGLSALMIFNFTGCENNKKEEIHIGYFNNITHPQALVMKNQGTLEKAMGETKVKWTAFNAGPAEIEALYSGDIDIGYIGPGPAISANVKSKGDVGILAGASKGGAILVKRKDAGIEEVKDLAGKNVAVPQLGNTQHLSLLNLLAENDLKPVSEGGDVKISAVANADVGNTMERGDIDAAIVPEPWGATLLKNGAQLLLDYEAIYMDGDYDVAVVVVRKEFKQEHPEYVDKFLKEHKKITEQMNADQEKYLAIVNDELKKATGKEIGDDILREAFTRIGISDEVNEASIRGFANISKEQGFIKELPEESLFLK